jgi:hypothetical protein
MALLLEIVAYILLLHSGTTDCCGVEDHNSSNVFCSQSLAEGQIEDVQRGHPEGLTATESALVASGILNPLRRARPNRADATSLATDACSRGALRIIVKQNHASDSNRHGRS